MALGGQALAGFFARRVAGILGAEVFRKLGSGGVPLFYFCPFCPLIEPFEEGADWRSLFLGEALGFLLGPFIDLLYLFMVSWITFVHDQIFWTLAA